jgi:ABC-type lipoprotein release transport system permease subunit
MNLKLAWRNLWRNKRRTLITVASIFFGVLLSTFMTSMHEGTYSRMIDNVVGFYIRVMFGFDSSGLWGQQDHRKHVAGKRFVAESNRNTGSANVVPRLESLRCFHFRIMPKGLLCWELIRR